MMIALKLTLLVACAFGTGALTEFGSGIGDVTGPSVQVNFMGYADTSQVGSGIMLRCFARAFVWREQDSNKTIAFVSVDGQGGSDLVNTFVAESLEVALPGVFTIENIAISGTHSHNAPGMFQAYLIYQSSGLGFVHETFDAWVKGITTAVVEAYRNLKPTETTIQKGMLFGTNINRSPTSYILNPADEQKQYELEGDTDKKFLQLEMKDADTKNTSAVLNWFAVHGTSSNKTNTLVSGDNRGLASYYLERDFNGVNVAPGHGKIVTAFASTNLGDVSPNTAGPLCRGGPAEGQQCDALTSTCDGTNTYCWRGLLLSGELASLYDPNTGTVAAAPEDEGADGGTSVASEGSRRSARKSTIPLKIDGCQRFPELAPFAGGDGIDIASKKFGAVRLKHSEEKQESA